MAGFTPTAFGNSMIHFGGWAEAIPNGDPNGIGTSETEVPGQTVYSVLLPSAGTSTEHDSGTDTDYGRTYFLATPGSQVRIHTFVVY